MSARVLVIDDVEANLRLIEALLARDYYEVLTAQRGEAGIQLAKRLKPDVILLDVMMPGGMDGFETCRRLKADPDTRHIPVILVTALDDQHSRLRGLQAGAEDFLTKPIDDIHLLTRVKNLLGLKVVIDELRAREANGRKLGVIEEDMRPDPVDVHRLLAGNVLVVDDSPNQIRRIEQALATEHDITVFGQSDGRPGQPDLIIVSLTANSFDGKRIIARMRSSAATRHLPILAVVEAHDRAAILRALELGAHDIIARPVDGDEIRARARTLMRRKRYADALRLRLDQSMELAVTDQLTGLYNRRFLMSQLASLLQRAQCGGSPVALLLADIDHFKKINDAYGHDIGDDVIREFAVRMATNARPTDFTCRLGGEEFVLIMPNTSGDEACAAAERLRRCIAGAAFNVGGPVRTVEVTVSIGVSASGADDDTPQTLLKRADEGLYDAKRSGRNRVAGKAVSAAA
jgi:two-component system cell cycle response regulator